MTRRLCIVSRESSALLGYLMVALRREPSGSDDLEFVVDRRHGPDRPAHRSTERRHGRGTDSVLTSHGYAIVEAEVAEPEVREAPAASGRPARARPGPGRAALPRPVPPPEPEPDYVELEPLESPDGARRGSSRRSLALGTLALCGLGAVALTASLVWQMMGGFSSPPRIVTPTPTPDVAVTRAPDNPAPATPPPSPSPVEPSRAVEPPAAPPAEGLAPAPPPPAPARAVDRPVAPPPRSSPSSPATASRPPAQKRALAEPPRTAAAPTKSPAPAAPAERPVRSPAFAGLPRVDLASEADGTGAARTITYTAQLRDPDNRPLVGADVSVHGTMREGGPLMARLEPTGSPGVYRGRAAVGRQTPADVRVRVVMGGTRFEVPLER
ncbi:MAG TPA: hypothetical protein VML54_17630 [Candidatus Limnocylindrales bacterium]|nr:hypothetical protein [Candidatus Limnocylindrales bacterium]